MKYINKIIKDVFIKGISKLEIKIKIYKKLDKELKGKDREHLKLLEYEIQQLENDEMEFTDYIVERIDKHNYDKNLTFFDEENPDCQIGDDYGRELNFR